MNDIDIGPDSLMMIGSYASDYSLKKKHSPGFPLSTAASAVAAAAAVTDENKILRIILYRVVKLFVLGMKGSPFVIFGFYCFLLWRSATKEMDEELRASWEIIRSGRKSIWQVWKSVSCNCYVVNSERKRKMK